MKTAVICSPWSVVRFCVALGALIFALCVPSEAQQPTKIPRIGYLALGSGNPFRTEAFRQGLRELGYVEGKNIIVEYRYAEGKFDRQPALAAELVRLKVDVIVTAGPPSTRAAKEATATIPIVMTQVGDPVGSGLRSSSESKQKSHWHSFSLSSLFSAFPPRRSSRGKFIA